MPEVSDHLVKSLMRLVRPSTTVPITSNTSALTADTSDMEPPFVPLIVIPGRAQRELWCAIAHLRISRFRVRCFASPRNDGHQRSLAMVREGGCLCGAVRFRTEGE